MKKLKNTVAEHGYLSNNHVNIIRANFIEICRVILMSDDEKSVNNAFNQLFKTYIGFIKWNQDSVSISILDDVINKIFTESEDIERQVHIGKKYNEFKRLISALSETLQNININSTVTTDTLLYKYITKLSSTTINKERLNYIKLICKIDVICFT